MKIQKVFEYVDEIKPNAFSNVEKIVWLNEVESMVQADVLLLAPSSMIQYVDDSPSTQRLAFPDSATVVFTEAPSFHVGGKLTISDLSTYKNNNVSGKVVRKISSDGLTYTFDAGTFADIGTTAESGTITFDDSETEMLVSPPHQKIYYTYLMAMIDFANGEYDEYQNTMTLFNVFFTDFTRWYMDTYRPGDGECEEKGYYLSAYAIAVKHGYVGTEEQWLASLQGDRAVSTQEAQAAAAVATESTTTAGAAKNQAAASAQAAAASAGYAGESELNAAAAKSAAIDAKEAASSAAAAALVSATAAGEKAVAAASSAATAATSATNASAAAAAAAVAKIASETAQAAAEASESAAEAASLVSYDDVPTAGSVKPVKSGGIYTALDGKADLVDGNVPASQLPSYVDDVIEAATSTALPVTGETGKIYVTLSDNKVWRWSGTAYVEVSASLALGETAATAYRGDRGKAAYDHSLMMGNPHNTAAGDVSIGDLDGYFSGISNVETAFAVVNDTLTAKQDKIVNDAYGVFYGSGTSGNLSQIALPATAGSVLRQDTSGAPYWTTLAALVTAMKSSLVDTIYPVNSIYMSVSSTSPATLFGGTWTQLQDRFLLGAGSSYSNGSTGGAATVTLTESQIPSHTHVQNSHNHTQNSHNHTQNSHSHSVPMTYGSSGSSSVLDYTGSKVVAYDINTGGATATNNSTTATNQAATASNQNTGGGGSHNNLPPYLVVYMWKRTA